MPNIIRVPGGGQTKIPSDLSPLCPNFTVERNGTKVKISADKIQLNSYTNMVSGGVWAWGKTRPTKPTGENTKLWTRAELITTVKPYDGLYLGDVTASDAVTETLIYLPENIGGKVVLSAFIILSTNYLGGVYITRLYTESEWLGAFGTNSTYAGSTADNWFEKTYLGSILHESVSSQLLTCDVPVMNQGTVSRRCWPLSSRELDSASSEVGGEFMPYFSTAQRRISYLDGGTIGGVYWMRTKSDATKVFTVTAQGGFGTQNASYTPVAYRPCFVLPKDFKIQQRPDGSYTVWNEQGLMTLGDIEVSSADKAVEFNIPIVSRSDSSINNKKYAFVAKEYLGTKAGILTNIDGNFETATMNAEAYNTAPAYTKLNDFKNGTGSTITYLHEKIRAALKSIPIKYRNRTGSILESSESCFLLSAADAGLERDWTSQVGATFPYYTVASNRIIKDGFGIPTSGWLRDMDATTTAFFLATAGNIASTDVTSNMVLNPSLSFDLTTPVRALADGSYDLVPDDPALSAQGVSTMADEEEVPLEIELDWPESDPLIARQWVYNEKGVYQTMLLGGVASTEDAPAYSPVLSENTWEQIAQACADRDPILDSWLVGDEKDEVINGETLTFVIVGKDHDDLADGSGKAPLSFGMKNLMANTRRMNASNTNSGGITGSEIHSWMQDTLLNQLPAELKSVLKSVNKKTSAGGRSTTVNTDAMKLFLFAEKEVYGVNTYSTGDEGMQYPYFATSGNRIKKLSNGTGAANYWWLRSPCARDISSFCFVDVDGSTGYNAATILRGVCFGFCI